MAAKPYTNPTKKRNCSIRQHTDCTNLQYNTCEQLISKWDKHPVSLSIPRLWLILLRLSEQGKQGPFKALFERAKQTERGREWESKAAKRLFKQDLASKIGILKS